MSKQRGRRIGYRPAMDSLGSAEVEAALKKLSPEERAEIDRLAADLEEGVKNKRFRKSGFSQAQAYELLAKLGIWMERNDIVHIYPKVD